MSQAPPPRIRWAVFGPRLVVSAAALVVLLGAAAAGGHHSLLERVATTIASARGAAPPAGRAASHAFPWAAFALHAAMRLVALVFLYRLAARPFGRWAGSVAAFVLSLGPPGLVGAFGPVTLALLLPAVSAAGVLAGARRRRRWGRELPRLASVLTAVWVVACAAAIAVAVLVRGVGHTPWGSQGAWWAVLYLAFSLYLLCGHRTRNARRACLAPAAWLSSLGSWTFLALAFVLPWTAPVAARLTWLGGSVVVGAGLMGMVRGLRAAGWRRFALPFTLVAAASAQFAAAALAPGGDLDLATVGLLVSCGAAVALVLGRLPLFDTGAPGTYRLPVALALTGLLLVPISQSVGPGRRHDHRHERSPAARAAGRSTARSAGP